MQQTGAQFYYRFVEGIKQRIRVAQIKAAISANRELILLYWDIGRAIVDAQKDKGYGKRVVEMLSADLRREFPEMAGLTARNLWLMRAFFLAYAGDEQILKQPPSPRRVPDYQFTPYFENQVMRKRPYLTKDMCIRILRSPHSCRASRERSLSFLGQGG